MFVVNIGESSAKHIHCEVLHKASANSFVVIVVYEFNDYANRVKL